jgi:ubiquitin carboxyl-terminal hydrolase 4/11
MLQELNQENTLGSGGKVALAFTALLSRIWHGDN